MKFLSNSLKVTFLLLSVLFLNGCSSDEDSDETTANIEGAGHSFFQPLTIKVIILNSAITTPILRIMAFCNMTERSHLFCLNKRVAYSSLYIVFN